MDKIFKIPIYQLYLFQLENYELKRFWKLLFKKGILPPKRPLRKSLVWTMKARVVFLCAVILHIVIPLAVFFLLSHVLSVLSIKYYVLCILLFLILYTLYFILYTIALLFLWPFDFFAKRMIIIRAKSRIRSLDRLKIIGIAGSYGKTTMKEILHEVLSAKFKVASTPESVNTPVGIGRWVLDNFPTISPSPVPRLSLGTSSPSRGEGNIEVAIVEMGEHYQGDISYLCNITPPDIAVVTGINEAHLERMKTMDNIVATIFEIVDSSKPKALVILNGDDKNVIENYKKHVWPDHRIERFKIEDLRFKIFNQDELCWEAELDGVGKVKINLLGEYVLGDVKAAFIIAKHLGMSNEEIKIGIAGIESIEHRLQPIKGANNVLIIDDSYNGNPDGAREAIKVLSRFVNRRKIYVTPGLAEIGKRAAEVHRKIGQELAKVADLVILIKNSVTSFIAQGLIDSHFDEKKILWYDTAQEAQSSLPKILQPNDVILFQNDWGDQYL